MRTGRTGLVRRAGGSLATGGRWRGGSTGSAGAFGTRSCATVRAGTLGAVRVSLGGGGGGGFAAATGAGCIPSVLMDLFIAIARSSLEVPSSARDNDRIATPSVSLSLRPTPRVSSFELDEEFLSGTANRVGIGYVLFGSAGRCNRLRLSGLLKKLLGRVHRVVQSLSWALFGQAGEPLDRIGNRGGADVPEPSVSYLRAV